jgi:hypothetical protein
MMIVFRRALFAVTLAAISQLPMLGQAPVINPNGIVNGAAFDQRTSPEPSWRPGL